jgi:hypothetical protein
VHQIGRLITLGSTATSRFGCIICVLCWFFYTFFTPISVQRVNGRDARRNGRRCSYEGNSVSKLQIQVATYVILGYPQRNAAHMGSISLWISFAASIFFAHKKHNATLFCRGTCIQGRCHLVTAATSVQSCAYRSLCVTIKLDSVAI